MKFEVITINRTDVKNAPYNPRIISERAAKRLRENIERVGLLTPPIWNRRTGFIVGGHRRLEALDIIHRGKPYSLPVAAVDLDEKTEREQNIFLNNREAQGDWDMEKLNVLLAEVDAVSAGFDHQQVYEMFGKTAHAAALKADILEAMASEFRDRKQRRERFQKMYQEQQDPNFYLVLVFKDSDAREAAGRKLGLKPWTEFADGRVLDRLDAANGHEDG